MYRPKAYHLLEDSMTSLIPWYEEQKNTSTCTINIGKQMTYVNYTILATEDFIRKYDPSCVTYDLLLVNKVRLSPSFTDKYYLIYIELKTRNRTQPVGPLIRVDSPLYKQARKLRLEEVTNADVVTKEIGENVREQFTRFLDLSSDVGSHINTEQRQIYKEPTNQTFTRMEAQITFNNSRLAASGINYTCPTFKQLVKASLDSLVFYSNKIYLWKSVNLVEEKSDGRPVDKTTTSPAPDQTSAVNDSVTTVRTTTRGGGGDLTVLYEVTYLLSWNIHCFWLIEQTILMPSDIFGCSWNNLVSRLNNFTSAQLERSARNALSIANVQFQVVGYSCVSPLIKFRTLSFTNRPNNLFCNIFNEINLIYFIDCATSISPCERL
ncbi:hypothetical protein EG68_01586 [Paragonimus skrjabini miyazakii]|uniref:Uncharacterized protein n=1 Tax=Paragonimus skrjabini miyazakii TaxID=59628 RepID=A0A8S9Z1N8_9TREM|nr:hypothetical protein EG68_01586 [Paragonimus skrjabini miyazakii]